VRPLRLQESASKTRRIRSGIAGASIAGDRIVRVTTASRRTCRCVVARPLRVVENVECFHAKLHRNGFVNRKVLEHCHVKVQSARIIQQVSAGVSEGQPGRGFKGCGVEEQGARPGTSAAIAAAEGLL